MQVQKPRRADLHGKVAIIKVREGFYRGIGPDHHALRIVLEVRVDGDDGQTALDRDEHRIAAHDPEPVGIERNALLDLGVRPADEDVYGHPKLFPDAFQ